MSEEKEETRVLEASKCILCGHITPHNYYTGWPLDLHCVCGESLLNREYFTHLKGVRHG